uniref:Uncharacterized protein n=1 Tax=Amphimedon queenslandica TaxID=400682 RepID=A0A1X7VD42_AMPQE
MYNIIHTCPSTPPPPTSSRSDCSGLDSGSSLKLVECEVE